MCFMPINRERNALYANKIIDMLPKNDLSIFIVDLVDKLDLSPITKEYSGRGNQAYHPSMMVSLLFYSYATGNFSS